MPDRGEFLAKDNFVGAPHDNSLQPYIFEGSFGEDWAYAADCLRSLERPFPRMNDYGSGEPYHSHFTPELRNAPPYHSRTWEELEQYATIPTQCLTFYASLARTMLATASWKFFYSRELEGPCALLPLCREKGYFSRWRIPGAREIFEPGDCLAETTEAAATLAAKVVDDGRPIMFDRVPADSSLVTALQGAMKGRGWLVVRSAIGCPTIPLTKEWEEPESCFNKGRQSDFRRALRRAEQVGCVSYEMLYPEKETFDALFDEAMAVELNSWKRDAGTAMGIDKEKEKFFREYFRQIADKGRLRIAFLRVDGRAIAMQLALEWRNRFWLFKIGYDESFGRCSPGTLLMLNTIGWAAKRGLSDYEFLGGVEPWIANFWTNEIRPCVQIRSYPFGLRGAFAILADACTVFLSRFPKPLK